MPEQRPLSIRHLARQRALQLHYALEYAGKTGESAEDIERGFLAADRRHRRGWGPFARDLARQAWARRAELDEAIRPALRNWSLERIPLVDRLCLRIAMCELAYFPEIPLRVTINEYIEISRLFGNDESPVYINAVLDNLARAFPHKDFQIGEETEAPLRLDPAATIPLPPTPAPADAPPAPSTSYREMTDDDPSQHGS